MKAFERAPLPVWLLAGGATLALLAGFMVPLALLVGLWVWQHRDGEPTLRQRRWASGLITAVGLLGGALLISLLGIRFGEHALAWLSGSVMLALLWRLEDRTGRFVGQLMVAAYTVLVLAADPSIYRAMLLIAGAVLLVAGHFADRRLRGLSDPVHVFARPAERAPSDHERALVSQALLRPTAVIVAVTTVFAFAAYLALPEPGGGSRRQQGGGGGGFGQSWGGRSMLTYAGGDLGLNSRGKLPDVAVAEVPADSPLYWRMGVLDSYVGHRWVDTSGAARSDLWKASGDEQRYTVQPREGFMGTVIAPGAPTAISAPYVGWGAYRFAVAARGTYSVTALPYPSVHEAGAGIDGTDPRDDPSDPRWLRVPADNQRVRDLAATLPGNAENPTEAATAIENYLRSAPFRYDLNAPVPPHGVDPVEYFLFDSHSGFCEHYASAAALLLRAKGIPARVATGFAGGSDEGGARVIKGTNAHAWVEVYVEGRGWVTSEPTPAAASTAFVLTDTHKRLIAGALVLAVLLAVWLFSRGRAPRRRSVRRYERDEVVEAVLRLQHALRASGQSCPPSATLQDLAAFTRERTGEADDVFDLVERHCYAAGGISAEQRLHAVDRLDALTIAVRRELVGDRKR